MLQSSQSDDFFKAQKSRQFRKPVRGNNMKMNSLHLEQLDEGRPKKVVLMLAGIGITWLPKKKTWDPIYPSPEPEESRGALETCTSKKKNFFLSVI